MDRIIKLTTFIALILALAAARSPVWSATGSKRDVRERTVDRSPVDLAMSADRNWIVTANEESNTVSLVKIPEGRLLDEIKVGDHPSDIEFCSDDNHLLVSCAWSGEVIVLRIQDDRLVHVRSVDIGFEPHGIAVSRSNGQAFVGLVASAQVAQIDWQTGEVIRRIDVGNWPRYLALSKDESRLAVGCGGDGKIMVIDAKSGDELYQEPLANGLNLGHMITSSDGLHAYFTWMVYRTNPITVGNIRRGWILASRIGRVRLDGPSYREAISLDVPGMAVSDPLGLVISRDEQTLVASASGTHELLVYRLPDLPFVGTGGPGDLIDRGLARDRDRFHRIDVGGRPMGLRMADDNQTVYVANYLRNSLQVVDLESRSVQSEIALGSGHPTLARKGMEYFYDGTRSLDQWYSCHSCHQNGGVNSRPMDTMNDGTEMTLKTVLPLYDVRQSQPWTWHGWQTSLDEAMHKSVTSTMLGKAPSKDDKQALIEFLGTLKAPPNPFRGDAKIVEAAARGKLLFESSRTGCADCHNGPLFSDGQIHDVGLGSASDFYQGYNTPSLVGVYRKLRLLHSGRARSLDRVINDLHSPEKVNGEAALTEQESADLIAYLKTL